MPMLMALLAGSSMNTYAQHFSAALPTYVTGLLILIAIWIGYRFATRALTARMKRAQRSARNIEMAVTVLRYGGWAVGLVYLVITLSGSLPALGISTAFLTAMLGWSLQRPVTGLAAWLMIMLKRPFSIGDRVVIAGIRGDVAEIGLTHLRLNEVGGTVGGDENSNREILIPNAMLFDQIITNYASARAAQFIIDEVSIRITRDSNWDEAEAILLGAAREVTEEIIRETQHQPRIRADLADAGLYLRLRYQTLALDRQRISTEIIRIILRRVRDSADIKFA